MLTFEQAQEVHYSLSNDTVLYPLLRGLAAESLQQNGWPEDEGMGTSDISIALTHLIQRFDIPLVGAVREAYAECGFDAPSN